MRINDTDVKIAQSQSTLPSHHPSPEGWVFIIVFSYLPLHFGRIDNASVIYHWSVERLLIPEVCIYALFRNFPFFSFLLSATLGLEGEMLSSFILRAFCKCASCSRLSWTVLLCMDQRNQEWTSVEVWITNTAHLVSYKKKTGRLSQHSIPLDWNALMSYLSKIRTTFYCINKERCDSSADVSQASILLIFFDCANHVNSCSKSRSNRSGCTIRGSVQLLDSVHRATKEFE